MIFERVFQKMQDQYLDMHTWMKDIKVSFDVLCENNSTQTVKNGKILKRLTRIEEKLKIVNVEEPIPLTEEQLKQIEGD